MQFSISTIAAVATIFSSVAQAAVVEGRAVASVPGWEYQGCKTDSVTARALVGTLYFDELMTVEKCAIACSNYAYMGVQYGHECRCGDVVNAGTVSAPETDCSSQCQGDTSESCGGALRLNLYMKSAPVAAPQTYNFNGCFTDNTNNRALKGAYTFNDDMTTEKCSQLCSGWTLFGTEYGRECFCGNSLATSAREASISQCAKPCDGDSSEDCGDSLRLMVYQYNA